MITGDEVGNGNHTHIGERHPFAPADEATMSTGAASVTSGAPMYQQTMKKNDQKDDHNNGANKKPVKLSTKTTRRRHYFCPR